MKISPLKVIDYFLPDWFEAQNKQSMFWRGRTVVAICLMYLFSLVSLAVIFSIITAIGIMSVWSIVTIAAIDAIIYSCLLVYFKRTGNLFRSANMAMCTMISGTITCIATTGGWGSPVLIVFLCSSVCAFLMGGRTSGIFWSFFITICYGLFYLAHSIGFILPNFLEEWLMPYLILCSWIYSWAIIFGAVAVYGSLAKVLNASINLEQERLRDKATYDSVTGIYNRQSFQKFMRHRIAESSSSKKEFLFLDINIINTGILPLEYEEKILVAIVRALQGAYPHKMVMARGSGLSLMALVDEIDNAVIAMEAVDSIHNIIRSVLVDEPIETTIGGVTVPGYSTQEGDIVSSAHKAIQEAKKNKEPAVLYSDTDRIKVEAWTDKNWERRRYSEMFAPSSE